jgi:hypothetical protein
MLTASASFDGITESSARCLRTLLTWIDGSVIDAVEGFLKLIEAERVLYRLSVQGGCGLYRA